VGELRAGPEGVDGVPGRHGVGLFDSRSQLKYALGKYAEHRATGPMGQRFASSTWGQHMSVLSLFYRWAIAEDLAQAEPFTYRDGSGAVRWHGREVRVNLAVRRSPKPHVTIKYLEPDFTALFLQGLRGLGPDGHADSSYRVGSLHATALSASWRWPLGCACGSSATCCPTRSGAAAGADGRPDPVPGAGWGDQGP